MFVLGGLAGRGCKILIEFMLKKRDCAEKASLVRKLPFPEGINGVLWVVTVACYGLSPITPVYCAVASVLFMIAIVDGCTCEIPAVFTLGLFLLGVLRVGMDLTEWELYLWGCLLTGGILLGVYVLTKKKGIGGGDIKLMAAAGLVLGISKVMYALLFGCLLAVGIHFIRMKREKKGHVFALGPYLAIGILGMLWFGESVIF